MKRGLRTGRRKSTASRAREADPGRRPEQVPRAKECFLRRAPEAQAEPDREESAPLQSAPAAEEWECERGGSVERESPHRTRRREEGGPRLRSLREAEENRALLEETAD